MPAIAIASAITGNRNCTSVSSASPPRRRLRVADDRDVRHAHQYTLSRNGLGREVGLARRTPAEDAARGAPPRPVADLVDVALVLGRPHGFDAHADAHLVGRDLEDVLEAEHAAGVVEQDRRLGERLGLLLPVVLHRRDDREVRDDAVVLERRRSRRRRATRTLDRAVAARRHVHETRLRAVLPDELALQQRRGVAAHDRAHQLVVLEVHEVVHHRRRVPRCARSR